MREPPRATGDLTRERAAGSDSGTRSRRRFLRYAGAAGASLLLAGCGSSDEPQPETETEAETETRDRVRVESVAANEQRQFELGSGDVFEDTLIDISAPGADAQIYARGDDWAIRNVGFRGESDRGYYEDGYTFLIDALGTGVVDTVYLGDGVAVDGIRKGGIHVNYHHTGHIDFENLYVAGWSDNGIYAAGMAEDQRDGGEGTVAIRNSYLRDNNIAHLRVASDGSTVDNCVVHNTNRVPEHPMNGGVVSSRGVYTGYGEPSDVVTVRNTDITVTPENTNGRPTAVESGTVDEWGPLSTVRVVQSRLQGAIRGRQVMTENIEPTPTTALPSGVPPDVGTLLSV